MTKFGRSAVEERRKQGEDRRKQERGGNEERTKQEKRGNRERRRGMSGEVAREDRRVGNKKRRK